MSELEELRKWKAEQLIKIEEWAKQQVSYTEEILFLMDTIKEDGKEIDVWRNEYIEMLNRANKWKKRALDKRIV